MVWEREIATADMGWQIVKLNCLVAGAAKRNVQHVAQLTEIARPVMAPQCPDCGARDLWLDARASSLQESRHDVSKRIPALTEGRKGDARGAEAM